MGKLGVKHQTTKTYSHMDSPYKTWRTQTIAVVETAQQYNGLLCSWGIKPNTWEKSLRDRGLIIDLDTEGLGQSHRLCNAPTLGGKWTTIQWAAEQITQEERPWSEFLHQYSQRHVDGSKAQIAYKLKRNQQQVRLRSGGFVIVLKTQAYMYAFQAKIVGNITHE